MVSTLDANKTRPNSIGKYQVIGTLGRGSMGVVYKARDPEIGRFVAIKTLRKLSDAQMQGTDEALRRFRIEAQSAGNLRHPNIVTVFDVNIQDDMPYIVMDYVEGESLDQVLTRCGKLRKDLALYYLRQIAAGLDAAHAKGVIHRDIKPSNIVVDKNESCYIADFGVASVNESLSDTASQDHSEPVMGTPGYMAPEQILNKRLDARSDLFAFAVVAFECFTGQRPFPGGNFTEVLGNILNAKPLSLTALVDLPLALEAEFERALAKKPEDRFPSGEALVTAFARALGMDRVEKPALSAAAGEERGRAKRSNESEWKSVPLDLETEEKPRNDAVGAHGSSAAALKKTPNVPLGDDESGERTVFQPVTSWDSSRSAQPPAAKTPGEMFQHLNEPKEAAVAQPRRARRLVVGIGVLLLLALMIIIKLLADGSAPPTAAAPTLDLPPPLDAAPVDAPSGETLPGEAPQLQTEPVPPGKMVTEMNDREILGLLLSPETGEEQLLDGLAEAKRRNLPELVEAGRTLLKHDSYMVRMQTIRTLKELGDSRAVPLLVEALNDHDALVRGTTANALGALGSRKALGYLSESYQREDVPEVKIAIKRAIEKINGYSLKEESK